MSEQNDHRASTPRLTRERLAGLMHNSWLYTHERDEIWEALDTDAATEDLYQTMHARIRERLASWQRSR